MTTRGPCYFGLIAEMALTPILFLPYINTHCHWNDLFSFLTFLFIFERQSMSGGGAERWGDTESQAASRLSAVSREPGAARTHEPWDHDLSGSGTINWLSHPGIPWDDFFKHKIFVFEIYQLLSITFGINCDFLTWSDQVLFISCLFSRFFSFCGDNP